MTLSEVSHLLRVDPRTVRRYIADGRLRAERVGPRLLRIDGASVAAMTRAVGVYGVEPRQRVRMRDAALEDFKSTLLTAGVVYAQTPPNPAERAEALTIYRALAVEAVMDLDAALGAIAEMGGTR